MDGGTPSPKPPDIASTSGQGSNLPFKRNRNKRTLPVWMDKNDQYGDAQFLLLQGKENTPLPRRPLVIETSVERTAGGPIAGAISEARGTKYTLVVRNMLQVEKLLKLEYLIDDTPVEVVHHPTRNICRCVITCWDFADTPTADILERLKDQGVTAVRRITQQNGKDTVNTGTMILTIRGAAPPMYVRLGLLQVATRPYYPSPMLCYNCLSYGHTKLACKGEENCQNCSNKHEDMGNCDRSPYCKNCDKNQKPTSRLCPVYRREQEIIKIKVDEGLTYGEARNAYQNRITSSKGTFSSIVQHRLTIAPTVNDEINELKTQLKLREEENKSLVAENEKLRNEVSNLQKSVNQLVETTKQLQQQLREQFLNQQQVFVAPSTSAHRLPSSQKHGESKKQTKQQHRSEKPSDSNTNPQYSSSEAETQVSHNKRSVSSPPKRAAKLRRSERKHNYSDTASKNQPSASDLVSEEEMPQVPDQ